MMIKSFICPRRYVQGAGALQELPKLLAPLGRKIVLVLDPGVQFLKAQLQNLLQDFDLHFVPFGGESTESAMQQAATQVRQHGCQVVMGIGGGKAIDTAKGALHFAPGPRLVVVPTISASDAPCSKNAVVYNEEHCVVGDIHGLFNPDIVLVDSQIIANAPTRYLSAGIGDGLSTWLEAEAVQKTMIPNFTGYSGTLSAFALARLCYDTLRQYGPLAVQHCDHHLVSPQLDAVIEANTLMSTIGFESGGLASAHGFHQGIAEWEETHSYLHGEKVAIGIVASLFLTGKTPAVIADIYNFCLQVRLPICLADIGVSHYDDDYLMIAVERMMRPVECTHNEPIRYKAEDYLNSLKAADVYGRLLRQHAKTTAPVAELA